MSLVGKRVVGSSGSIERRDFLRWSATGVVATALGVPLLTAGTAQASGLTQGLGVRAGRTLYSFTNGDSYVLFVDQVGAGLVTTTLFNTDFGSPHQAQIARLQDGKSVKDFGAAIGMGNVPAALGMLVGFYGGPNVVATGAVQTTYQNLEAGQYILLCFVADPGGPPHFVMGMFAGFEVVGPTAGLAAPRNVTATVQAADEKKYVIPAALRSHSVIRFENNASKDVHEFTIGQLLPGKTIDQVSTWAGNHQGPPPFMPKGGNGALNPGEAGWFKLSLPRGNYVAFCLVPDDTSGTPHAADGMVSAFTVI